MQLTRNNHFQFGYDTNKKWVVSYGHASRPVTTWEQECINTADEIFQSTIKPIQVCFSGGVDSEVVAESFRKSGNPFEITIMRFENNLNLHDIEWAIKYCDKHKIKCNFYDINVHDFYKLGSAYDMPSFQVDGMHCETVHEAIESAVANARKGNGPTLLEMKTYRFKGHSMSDASTYRTKVEVEEYKLKDPIESVLLTIKNNKWATPTELEEIEKRVKDIVAESVKFGEDSPYPTVDELYKDVYTQEDYPFIKE